MAIGNGQCAGALEKSCIFTLRRHTFYCSVVCDLLLGDLGKVQISWYLWSKATHITLWAVYSLPGFDHCQRLALGCAVCISQYSSSCDADSLLQNFLQNFFVV